MSEAGECVEAAVKCWPILAAIIGSAIGTIHQYYLLWKLKHQKIESPKGG